jgi:PAS domain S-box-containing protein
VDGKKVDGKKVDGKKVDGKKVDGKKAGKPGSGRSLRDGAEEQLARSPEPSHNLNEQSPEELIHELQVHQIELETQAEELRKAHLALEESRDKFLDLYEFAPVGYLTLTDKARITEVNLTGVTLLGVERSRLIREPFSKFISEKDSDPWHMFFLNILKLDDKQSCTLTLKRGIGSMFPARLEGVRSSDSSGKTIVSIVLSDITDIWQIEALKKSETQIRATLESTADGILAVDKKGKVLQASRRFAEIWKIPQAVMESGNDRILLEFVRDQLTDPDAFLKKVELLYDSDAVDMDILNFKDGRVFERDSFPMILEGACIGRVWSFRDISEHRRLEEALHQANKKLNLLSSITRHDINNELTVLHGYLEMLETKLPDPPFNVYFYKAAAAAQRIAVMIRFTREYEEIGVYVPAWHDCRTLVDTAAKKARFDQVVLKNEFPAGTEVFADPLIVKVFFSLMDNALRYGGKCTTIRFSVEERDGVYVLVCEDDGDGVVAEEKERIFKKGFGKNAGLGLALSREILDITGITIKETGEPGRGARFEMAVPKGALRLMGTGKE